MFSDNLAKVAEGDLPDAETNLLLNPHRQARKAFEKYAVDVNYLIPSTTI